MDNRMTMNPLKMYTVVFPMKDRQEAQMGDGSRRWGNRYWRYQPARYSLRRLCAAVIQRSLA
jgi:hypothetical protein